MQRCSPNVLPLLMLTRRGTAPEKKPVLVGNSSPRKPDHVVKVAKCGKANTVRAEIITELILERAGSSNF